MFLNFKSYLDWQVVTEITISNIILALWFFQIIKKDKDKHRNNKRDFRYQVSLHYPDSGKEMLKTLLWASRVSYEGISCLWDNFTKLHTHRHTQLTRLPTHRHTHTISSTQKSHTLKKING